MKNSLSNTESIQKQILTLWLNWRKEAQRSGKERQNIFEPPSKFFLRVTKVDPKIQESATCLDLL